MVDEFQDTNWAQYELVKMLSAKNNNLVVVGDDDQSIYKFRGASISNILQFKDDYSKTKEVVLTKNYRSNQTILDQAYNFIQNNNPNRLETKLKIDKKLISVKDSEEKKKNNILPTVQFYHLNTDQEEAAFVASKILEIYNNPEAFKDKQGGEINWSDFAILIRANDQSEKFIKELSRHNIPNQFISLKGLYYKPIILDCIAYLKLLDNYHESSALFRVLSMDVFKVSYSELVAINKMADRKVWSLFEALQNINAIPNVSAEAVKNINRLFNLINAHSVLAKNDKPSKLFVQFIYDSGLVKYLDHDRDRELFSLLNQFYKKIKEAEEVEKDLRLKGFMERLDMEMAAGESGALQLEYEDADTVRIMTVHAAKGLEFKYVFVVNLVDKRFPSINRGERISIPEALVREKTIISSDIHLEEERRLFYVAMTRAKDILFLTAARDYGGASEKKISRFVPEAALDSREISLDLTANELFRDLIKLENGEVDNKPEVYELPDRFSFSQLAAYSTCPLQYKFNFILKIPVPIDKPSLIFGRVMHNVLQEFLKPLTVGNNKLQADLFGAAKGEVNKNLFNEKKLLELYENYWQNDGYHSKTEREKYKQKGLNSLNIFWQKITENTLPQVNFLEKDFSVKIGDYVLKGKIDRVDKLADGTIEIIDYKTGNPKEKIDWDDKRQLILYQIVMEEVFGIKVSALSYYYLENGEKISFLGKEKEIEKLKLEIISYINEIKKMNFTPTPSQLCDYCDFNGICEFRKR
jgi:DNA helicase-2/ATP-dependent DNA helicase PcrA